MQKTESKTLVVGGEYAMINGQPHVAERWLRMVEIFADNMTNPLFALRQVVSSDKDVYSVPFPYEVVSVNGPKSSQALRVSTPFIDWDKNWHLQLINKVDAVYCRFPSCYWEGYHIYRLALKRGKLVFASFHGDWASVYKHLASTAPALKKPAYLTAALLVHCAMNYVAKTSRMLFCVGTHLEQLYGKGASKTVVFANYLHKESDICLRHDTCLEQPYRIIFVGSLSSRKGVRHLVNVVAQLRSKGIQVVLDLVGVGEEKENLVSLARNLGIEEYIRWHGYLPFGSLVFEKYRKSDIFVLPSLVGEGMPKVVVEAMSQGLPVIATSVGSTEKTIHDSGGGIVVPPGDEKALLNALMDLIKNVKLRQRLISNGLEFAGRMTNDYQRQIVSKAFLRDLSEVMAATPKIE